MSYSIGYYQKYINKNTLQRFIRPHRDILTNAPAYGGVGIAGFLNLVPLSYHIRVYGVYLENGKQFEAITHILPERSRKDLQKRVLRKRKNSKIYSRQFPVQIKVAF